jgi:hypothetical protein
VYKTNLSILVCICWYHYCIYSLIARIMDHIKLKYIVNKTYGYINNPCLIFM